MKMLKARIILLFIFIVSNTPWKFIDALASVLASIVFYINNAARRVSQINIDLCFPHYSEEEKNKLLRNSLFHSLAMLIESSIIWRHSKDLPLSKVNKVHHLEKLIQAHKKGRGLIVIVPHLGNWELLNSFLQQHFTGGAMYRPAKLPLIDRFIRRSRHKTGLQLFATSKQGVAQSLRFLRNGNVLYVLADQNPDDGAGEFIDFFSVPAYTMTLVARLAQKCKTPVMAAVAKRHRGGRYDVHIVEADDDKMIGSNQHPLHKNVENMNALIEKCIALAPEQYLWSYKRFKSRPDRAENPY